MYRLLYIDEESEDREAFEDIMSDGDTQLIAAHPYSDETDMLDFIMREKFDCIIADFRLMGKDPNIKYDGTDLLKSIIEKREDFPVFILTRVRDEDDVDSAFEATRILQKSDLEDIDDAKELKRKIIKSIDYYRKQTEALENKLEKLILKRQEYGDLEDYDLQSLKDIDERLERRLNIDKRIPDVIKDSESLESLNKVLKEAEDFLITINKKK